MILLLGFGSLAARLDGTPAPAQRLPSVLLLFSQRSTAPAVQVMERAFRVALEQGLGGPVDLHAEYLDLPDASVASYGSFLSDLLREKYRGFSPMDVVAVDGLEGLRFLLRNRESLFPGVPVVFSNVARKPFEDLHPPAGVTGAFQVLEDQRTVRLALDLRPSTRRVVLVGGSSPTDRGYEALGRKLVGAQAPGRDLFSLCGVPLDEQLRRLAELPPDSVVIFLSYRADALGRSMIGRDVFDLVAQASNAPVFGASETWLGRGVVGGDMERPGITGGQSAGLVLRILRGEAASSIPPLEQSSRQFMFDWRQLRRWGIDEVRLPAGSVVLFREATLWSEHWRAILATLALLGLEALLIAALLVERRSRIRAEADTREAENRYRTVAEFTYDWEYWRLPDSSFAFVSPSCLRTTGHEAAEFVRRPGLMEELVVEEDRPIWEGHADGARTGRGGVFHLEFRIRTAGGDIRWIDHICTPVTGGDGQFQGVRGSNRDVTEKRQSEEDLLSALSEIDRLRERLEAENTYLREQVEPLAGFEEIVGKSDVLKYVLSRVQQVAPTSSTVLLQGESGVGKDLVAHAIHGLSSRRTRPLVKLNCAALAPSLVESELFGHEKGAFTGAASLRKGRFEIADGSTLFLDEVGELPLELQAKLLRVIQDGEFERVGGSRTMKTDVRLVAATNRQLDEEVRAGRFREDLWYRLNVFPITIPPLRQRREDIPLLARHFVDALCRKAGREPLAISQGTLRDLQAHHWPGNVRELASVLERAVITSPGPALRLDDSFGRPAVLPPYPTLEDASARTLEEVERQHIVATLESLAWRIEGTGGAAAVLGVNPSTLRGRMSKLGIRRPGRSQATT